VDELGGLAVAAFHHRVGVKEAARAFQRTIEALETAGQRGGMAFASRFPL
jgi:hypothetical protein